MKTSDLVAGEEYAARLFPKSPDIVSHIRLESTQRTVRRTYDTEYGRSHNVTSAMPAVSFQSDGTERSVHGGVLPKHIFARWEDYADTYAADQAYKDAYAKTLSDVVARVDMETRPNQAVVLVDGRIVARLTIDSTLDRDDVIVLTKDLVDQVRNVLRARAINELKMGADVRR